MKGAWSSVNKRPVGAARSKNGQHAAVAFIGELGCGNLGNDGSFAVLLDRLRQDFPHVRPIAFGYGVDAIRTRYGVEARSMNAGGPRGVGIFAILKKTLSKVVDPVRTWRQLRDVDVVVVPGAGVLEGHMGTKPLGLPYALWRTTAAARLRGIPVALIAVGASPTENRISRYFFRATANAAEFRTFRDAYSRQIVAGWTPVVEADPVVPDVAYGFDLSARAPLIAVDPRCVVVGIMAYRGPLSTPECGAGILAVYTTQVSLFVRRLVDAGWRVRLITGDDADRDTLRAVAQASGVPDRLEQYAVGDFDELTSALAPAAFVVATRFHNVLMSLRLGKPTIAAGYGTKNEELLRTFGLERYYLDPGDVTDESLWRLFEQLATTGDHPAPAQIQVVLDQAESQWAMTRDFLKEIV